ncbi:ion transporter [Nocardia sp. CC227C]|uniref:ion transporter n=1 Tax=Nocardia sp. CC227C TaxID=3044562 RepID=UPI00278C8760|nr:ion transporter [Nocardia sp. CC227C]
MARADWRVALERWVDSPRVRSATTALILGNAVVLGIETSATARAHAEELLTGLDHAFLAFFVVELALKLIAIGPRFFRSGWNVFDFVIIGVALAPAVGPLSVLRTLRVLRVMRLLSTVRRLRMLVDSLAQALPGIGWSAALLGLLFYVFAVVGTEMFGQRFPDWFGDLGRSLYSLFQIMTLESWSMGIARPVMAEYSYAWLYFVPFILLTSFVVLNLFIAIIVSATQEVHDQDQRAELETRESAAHAERQEMLELLRALNARLDALERGLDRERLV